MQRHALAILETKRLELESFVGSERIPQRTRTLFTRDLEHLH